jgi:uncharacterized membrane protein
MSENTGNDPLELVPSQPSSHKNEGAGEPGGMAPPPPQPPPAGSPPPPPPPDPDKPETKPDERTFGLVAHLSLLVCCIGPLVIYFSKGKESKFIKFHALQATFFMLFSVCCMLPVLATTAWAMFRALEQTGNVSSAMGQVIPHFGIDGCLSIFFTIYSIYIGSRAYKGYLAEYLVIGAIARRMVYGSEPQE